MDAKAKDILIEVVNTYVPDGKDLLLHVDRRQQMIALIEDEVDRNIIKCNIEGLRGICLAWRDILHERFIRLN